MTFQAALKASARSAALFAVMFLACSVLGDWYWDRAQPPVVTALAVLLASGIFWLLIAHRHKVKAS